MRLLTSSFVVAALLAAAGSAAAQTPQSPRSERPYRGLFGGDTGNAQELLTFSASFGGGYDDDIFAGDSGAGAPSQGNVPSTTFLTASADLGYSLVKSKVSFSANGGSGVGHYPGLNQPSLVHHNGGVSASFQVAHHSRLNVSQSETYQPFYFWGFLPTGVAQVEAIPVFDPGTMTIADAVQAASLGLNQPAIADTVAGSNAEYYLDSSTYLGYSQGLTRNLTFDTSLSYTRSDSKSGTRDFKTQSATAGLSYALAKGLALVFAYSYSDSEYPVAAGQFRSYQGHSINAGVNFNKALSFSRRTTLSFSTGTVAINDSVTTHYDIVGNVQLTHELGRSWSTGVGYYRSVSYVETFVAPVLTDSASGSLDGLISRAMQFQASVGLSRGNVGYGVASEFRSVYASTGLRYALTRNVALSTYYGYYHYDFDSGIVLPLGTPRNSNRQSISFSVEFWHPIIQRNRSKS
jgi:Protein of unknown function (DUF3575)